MNILISLIGKIKDIFMPMSEEKAKHRFKDKKISKINGTFQDVVVLLRTIQSVFWQVLGILVIIGAICLLIGFVIKSVL